MELKEQKMRIIEDLLSVQDHNILKQIDSLIQSSLLSSKKAGKNFSEWNSEFQKTSYTENEIIPELGMTLLQFRKKIFQAETSSKSVSFDKFKKEIKSWKRKSIGKLPLF